MLIMKKNLNTYTFPEFNYPIGKNIVFSQINHLYNQGDLMVATAHFCSPQPAKKKSKMRTKCSHLFSEVSQLCVKLKETC